MGFGGGFSKSGKGGALSVVSGSHGQVLRFYSGSAKAFGSDDWVVNDDGVFGVTGSMKIKGAISHSGSIIPENASDSLGSGDKKYSDVYAGCVNVDDVTAANVYTGDLHLKNERGDWTIHEERHSLVVRNNLTGEKFKIVLEKIEKK